MDRELTLLQRALERGLAPLYDAEEGLFCYSLRPENGALVRTGHSFRYTAICLLGVARLGGLGLEVTRALERVAQANGDLQGDDLGLALWALAAHCHAATPQVAGALAGYNKGGPAKSLGSIGTMGLAWMLSGAAEALAQELAPRAVREFANRTAEELSRRQRPSGLFQSVGSFSRYHLLRRFLERNIASLASQVYSIQAFARWAELTGEEVWRERALACARRLVSLQGDLGQWAWLYQLPQCRVAEMYPVYSVHQHAMVPMALLSLGTHREEFRPVLERSLRWLFGDNELGEFMCEPEKGVIWRAIQPASRESPELVAERLFGLSAEAWPGIYRAALGWPRRKHYKRLLVLRSMRPYELGWLAYTWEALAAALRRPRPVHRSPDTNAAARVMLLQLPSPPGMNVSRDYAGGFGTAGASPRADYGHDDGWPVVPNLQLATVASVLRAEGHEVAVCDAQAENLGKEALKSRLQESRPDWLLAQVCLPSLAGDVELLRDLRESFPRMRAVAYGPVCRALTADLLGDGLDMALLGDPELVFPAAVRNGFAEAPPGAVVQGAGNLDGRPAPRVGSLDDLPMPAYDLLPLERYRHAYFGRERRFMAVFGSKGCGFGCSYCPYPFGFGERAVYASPERVVGEVELLAKEFGVGAILFRDQNFTLPRQHAEAICRGLVQKGLRLPWVCETRLDCVDEGLLALMREAGCVRIHYGLESGDPGLLPLAKKGLNLEQGEKVIAATKRLGMHAHVFTLVGFPGETWKTINSTLSVLRRWRPTSVQAAIITPYPGTEYYRQAKEKGLICTEDWTYYDGFHAVMNTETMCAEELTQARRYLREAYLRGGLLGRAKGWMKRGLLKCGAGAFSLSQAEGPPPPNSSDERADGV